MDQLHFGARSRRKARRRQLMITAWLAGVVAAFFGVPGSNAAFGVLHLVDRSPALAASSFSGRHSGPGLGRSSEILTPPKPKARLLASAAKAAVSSHRHAPQHKRKRPGAHPSPTPTASPTPTPAPAPVPAPAGTVSSVIYAAAAHAGISGNYLLSVASCESSLNPGAYNSGGYYGLFQFDQETWSAYGYGSIYDPVAQANTAARLLAAGQSSRWPNCA
jgi:Transglycosylase-like domain